MSNINPTAIIDSSATIADDVHIGPYCVVGPNVTIQSGTRLLDHVTVQRDTDIGEDNIFYPFSVVGGDPQDKKFAGETTTLTIGDRNQIREHVTIHRGTALGGGITSIGDDNLLMVASHVAHDCNLGSELVIANQVMLAGHITVDDCATIGGGAGINQFARIGRCSYVGGLARITRDVPPYMIVEGTPAEVRAVNVVAMSRRGYSDVQIDAMKTAHRRLFRENGGALAQKMEQLLEELGEHEPVQALCQAMAASAAGKHGRSNEKVATA
ncbi:MAG TPA: acyl-ACP--UDP-N-acetylglucosamine O-acyltransferase [Phycisphaerales bacterium]|jgi:UDP-N-acetylglucosamine acyltransferase|nr:acyl-ACP--UDP-N-acetylglucosamine O-acyltransferase [Phycisphaerales bacterium]HIB49787.1 acyl-ACP--UDP-N-acetylglucosamine O-acyltransferase [Phycisphaerales bacterium]HIN84728.1 acyl-ACP--UDP-N-acetylglucosamine O-acyltransferase [Phycisphaerales bacterium]HIO19814.1 acyl-ACP--UDP-N-acetylglucosamine O-acyltransferase [Phycisphaerales bacterium]